MSCSHPDAALNHLQSNLRNRLILETIIPLIKLLQTLYVYNDIVTFNKEAPKKAVHLILLLGEISFIFVYHNLQYPYIYNQRFANT